MNNFVICPLHINHCCPMIYPDVQIKLYLSLILRIVISIVEESSDVIVLVLTLSGFQCITIPFTFRKGSQAIRHIPIVKGRQVMLWCYDLILARTNEIFVGFVSYSSIPIQIIFLRSTINADETFRILVRRENQTIRMIISNILFFYNKLFGLAYIYLSTDFYICVYRNFSYKNRVSLVQTIFKHIIKNNLNT